MSAHALWLLAGALALSNQTQRALVIDGHGAVHQFRQPSSFAHVAAQPSWVSWLWPAGAGRFEVDVVIPAPLEPASQLVEEREAAQIVHDRESEALKYTLRSIAVNAKWVRHIFILTKGEVEVPWYAPEPEKTTAVDWCSLFATECPGRSSLAVETVVHRVPGLRDHFLLVGHDDLLLQSSTVEDFFDAGAPRFWLRGPLEDVYQNLKPTGLLPSDVPKRFRGTARAWVPLKKAVCEEVEQAYPKWVAFVRSHAQGRYSSKMNAVTTRRSEKAEEEMRYVWWHLMDEGTMLAEKYRGTYSQPARVATTVESYTDQTWDDLMNETQSPYFLNIGYRVPFENGDGTFANGDAYYEGYRVMIDHLERRFPEQSSGGSFPVDIVVLSARSNASSGPAAERERAELQFTLRSIAAHAPWARTVHVLGNGHRGQLPAWVPETAKTRFVDQCALLPPGACPTYDAWAAETVVHDVPGLTEQFIVARRGELLMKPTTVNDFFRGPKPRYWPKGLRADSAYEYLPSTGLDPSDVPPRVGGEYHVWVPVTRTVCRDLERKYATWFAFIRSHTHGEYSSIADADDTGVRSSEEALQYAWWFAMATDRSGVHSHGERVSVGDVRGADSDYRVGLVDWEALTRSPPFFLAIRDHLPPETDAAYAAVFRSMRAELEEVFPPPGRFLAAPLPRAAEIHVLAGLVAVAVALAGYSTAAMSTRSRRPEPAVVMAGLIFGLYAGLSVAVEFALSAQQSAHDVIGAALVLKLAASLALWVAWDRGGEAPSAADLRPHKKTLLWCAAPGVAYVLADSLRAACLLHMDLSAFTTVYALRTPGIVALCVFAFGPISGAKWAALAAVAAGNLLHRSVTWSEEGIVTSEDTPRYYVIVALVSVLIAGGGGVANELLLKTQAAPLNLQNAATYAFGLVALCFASPVAGASCNPIHWLRLGRPGLVAAVLLAASGIVLSHLLKVLGNVWKEVAIAIQVVVAFGVDVAVFRTEYSTLAVLGVLIVFGGAAAFLLDGLEPAAEEQSARARAVLKGVQQRAAAVLGGRPAAASKKPQITVTD